MRRIQSTLILFLLDSSGIPNFGAEKYLCSLIETPEPLTSFSPSHITHDNVENRPDIIQLIEDFGGSDVTDIRGLRHIGEQVWENLGLKRVFSRIVANEGDVTFLTNDPSIPWEWASGRGRDSSICELMSCGTVFFEQMSQAVTESKAGTAWESPEERVKAMKAILLFDEGGHHNLTALPGVKQEVKEVRASLQKSGMSRENIREINGGNKRAEPDFLRLVREMGDDLGIIHYAGHVLNGGLRLTHSEIESSEIHDNLAGMLPRSLVFINGCESGTVPHVWEKSKNLSTAWLSAGACGMVGCRLPVDDTAARNFAVAFYENLLSPKFFYEPLGDALKETRKRLEVASGQNASWLQYTLFGYPYVKFLEPKPSEVATALAHSKLPDELGKLLAEDT